MDKAAKMQTMMRLGEMHCFDEEQRIAIMDMVKDGFLTVDEAFAEVKRTKPKNFLLKYHGATACVAPTLRPLLTPEQGAATMALALAHLKKTKMEKKVQVTVSTVGIRILDPSDGETLENEPLVQIAFAGPVPGEKKKVAYITSYSKLGLVYCHVFSCAKPKDADELLEAIAERKRMASESKSMVPPTGVEKMSAGVDADDDEDDSVGVAMGLFHLNYLGCAPAAKIEGADVVTDSILHINEALVTAKKAGKKADTNGTPVVMVISSEGIRTVESATREVLRNVVIRAISYSTEVLTKKVDMFAFIEVDDRRDTNTCHAFMCPKGQAAEPVECLSRALQRAVEEAKARTGNPFLAQGRDRDRVEGPLAECQIKRSELRALKIVGAGQFGKVYLSLQTTPSGDVRRAVKMLRSGASAQDREEFLREAEVMLRLGFNENLVGLVGVSVRQRPWLVILELCQYGDLSDILHACERKKIVLSLHENLRLALQIANGMEFIHSKRYVHMDLAARNCLMHVGGSVKVADFGLTRPYDSGQPHYRQAGVMKLSIRWLAIDSFDHKIFSERSDAWSFAVTMWELFTNGLQPYTGVPLPDVIKSVRSGARLERPGRCPVEVFELMETCWSKVSSRRPTFTELKASLQGILARTPGELRDVGALLSMEFESTIKRLSLQRGASLQPESAAAAAPVVMSGLMSVAEEAISPRSAAARMSVMMPGDAKLDGIVGK